MKTLILTLISVSLVNNVVLSQFLGLCPFLGVSKQTKTAMSMGGAVIFVITIASAVTHLLYRLLVLLHVEYLETVAFNLIISSLVQILELFLKKKFTKKNSFFKDDTYCSWSERMLPLSWSFL